MNKKIAIWGVTRTSRLQLKLLAAGRGMTMAKSVSELIDEAFKKDNTILTRKMQNKIKRIIDKPDNFEPGIDITMDLEETDSIS